MFRLLIKKGWWGLLVVIVVLGILIIPTAKAAEPGGQCVFPPVTSEDKCPQNYVCEGYRCVCAWGDLETDWFGLFSGSDKSICSLVGSGNGVSAVWSLLGAATTAVIALTIMAALVSIVVGGYIYMTAGGNADRVRTAKIWIGSAILGIILALLAWLILDSIATNLVSPPSYTPSSPTSTP